MGKKGFTEDEVKELGQNPYVKKVSKTSITYTQEFKEYFIMEYQKGKSPSQILEDAGFRRSVLGKERCDSISRNLRRMTNRPEGLKDLRKGGSGRPRTKDLTPEEEIQRLKHKIKYLEQENEFLKKIGIANKKAQQKQNRKRSSKSSKK